APPATTTWPHACGSKADTTRPSACGNAPCAARRPRAGTAPPPASTAPSRRTASPPARRWRGASRVWGRRATPSHRPEPRSRAAAGERAGATDVRPRLARLEPALAAFSGSEKLTDAQKARHDATRSEYGRLWREWSDLFATASTKAVLPRVRIQEAIPEDGA